MEEEKKAVFREAPTTMDKWIESQGIPVYREFSIPNLNEVAVGPWERLAAYGAYLALDGSEDTQGAYVLELAPGGKALPEKHIYEEVFYVLSGRGAATIWQSNGSKRTFEWHEGSLFSIPLNTWHQFFNGQSGQPTRFYVVSTAPLILNFYHNLDFVFNNDYDFTDRYDGRDGYFSADGQALPERIWETNFVEDVRSFPLMEWKERGAGGANRRFHLAEGTMAAHISRFPVGTYKKGHFHGPGAHVVIIQGQGYSLLWEEGKEDQRVRIDWKEGSVLVPPNRWFHQHFNTTPEPAAYLAIRWGSVKYPLFDSMRMLGKTDTNFKKGGNQIEYEDEDPSILQLFKEELAKNGVECKMPSISNSK